MKLKKGLVERESAYGSIMELKKNLALREREVLKPPQ